MVTRIWRGWAAEDSAAEIAASLRAGVLARFEAMPGNVSAEVLRRPLNGGVELMTITVWDAPGAVPEGVAEDHRLLVARETMANVWELAEAQRAVAQAA